MPWVREPGGSRRVHAGLGDQFRGRVPAGASGLVEVAQGFKDKKRGNLSLSWEKECPCTRVTVPVPLPHPRPLPKESGVGAYWPL